MSVRSRAHRSELTADSLRDSVVPSAASPGARPPSQRPWEGGLKKGRQPEWPALPPARQRDSIPGPWIPACSPLPVGGAPCAVAAPDQGPVLPAAQGTARLGKQNAAQLGQPPRAGCGTSTAGPGESRFSAATPSDLKTSLDRGQTPPTIKPFIRSTKQEGEGPT